MGAAWGVGKTLCAINRALIYSTLIPNNLGVVFRKTLRSLSDSTIRDFEKYTKFKVDSSRNFHFDESNSDIMFRHMDEIDSINQQNINLGWYYIEQAEELETDKEFFMLFGRLRRKVEPSTQFKALGLSERSGWIVANAGDNWVKKLFKETPIEDSELVEATTFDNKHNLEPDFIASLETIRVRKPEIYQRFVLNNWDVGDDQFIVIPRALIKSLQGNILNPLSKKRVISCDPSMGGDECVVYMFENYKIIDRMILHHKDTMKIVGEIMVFSHKHSCDDIAIDEIGIGAGIRDRLREMGKNIIGINSAESPFDKKRFYNRRAEMWWTLLELMQNREIPYPECDLLIDDLSSIKYKVVNSNGQIKLEDKSDVKKRLGRSPDKGDAYVYGIWAHQYVGDKTNYRELRHPINLRHMFAGGRGGW